MNIAKIYTLALISIALTIATSHHALPSLEHSTGSTLILNGEVIDGTGTAPQSEDVRIVGDTILEVGHLTPMPGETVIDASGLDVAPGFIDTLSHVDNGIMEDPLAETQIRQGITTSIVGQDGASNYPLKKWFRQVELKHVALNIASFVGNGTLRDEVTGPNYKRHLTANEIAKISTLVEQEMRSGGLGISTGLEYDPEFYSTTEELIASAKVAAKYGGIYASHIRNEGDRAFESFKELIRIAKEAGLPAHISHIKLATSPTWNRSGEAIALIRDARSRGLDISADVYPYTYWQSTIIVLVPTRDWDNRKTWQDGLAEIGGAAHVSLCQYTPNPAWNGKSISQIAATTDRDPISVIQEVVHKTQGPNEDGADNVVVKAMTDEDVKRFVCDPGIMFCSDGGLQDTHPRGAGSFPRVLGYYARETQSLPLEAAIHKMTELPAKRMGFADRGRIAPGMKADITLFDPLTVRDTATIAHPTSEPEGIPYVLVNGQIVLDNGVFTGRRPGAVLRHRSTAKHSHLPLS